MCADDVVFQVVLCCAVLCCAVLCKLALCHRRLLKYQGAWSAAMVCVVLSCVGFCCVALRSAPLCRTVCARLGKRALLLRCTEA
jgi:hypothetical protein